MRNTLISETTRPGFQLLLAFLLLVASLIGLPGLAEAQSGLMVMDFETPETSSVYTLVDEDDGFTSQLATSGEGMGISIVDAPGRAGHRAMRFASGPSFDRSFRTEVVLRDRNQITGQSQAPTFRQFRVGQEYWIGLSLYLQDFELDRGDGSSLSGSLFQLHAQGGMPGCPGNENMFTLDTMFHEVKSDGEEIMFVKTGVGGRIWSAPLVRREWLNFVVQIRVSDGLTGLLRVWLNEEIVVDREGPSAHTVDGCGVPLDPAFYPKYGVYQQPRGNPGPLTVLYDEVRIGSVADGYSGGYEGIDTTGGAYVPMPPPDAGSPSPDAGGPPGEPDAGDSGGEPDAAPPAG